MVQPTVPVANPRTERLPSCAVPRVCRVTTGARLHFGLLSVNNREVPSFGGVGLMVDDPSAVITVRQSDRTEIDASPTLRVRVEEWLARLESQPHESSGGGVQVRIEREIPAHGGYGSGTQTALAIGEAIARVQGDAESSLEDLAHCLGRAKRSAIGLAGYQQGGFLVDGGYRPADRHGGTIIARRDVPEAWRVVLVEALSAEGLSGSAEGTAFVRLPVMNRATSDRLCALIVQELLPGLIQADCERFMAGLVAYGSLVGSYFAGEQGGVYSAPYMDRVNKIVRACGCPGLAQSSWGPTAATLVPDEEQAGKLAAALESERQGTEYRVRIARVRNTGRTLETELESR